MNVYNFLAGLGAWAGVSAFAGVFYLAYRTDNLRETLECLTKNAGDRIATNSTKILSLTTALSKKYGEPVMVKKEPKPTCPICGKSLAMNHIYYPYSPNWNWECGCGYATEMGWNPPKEKKS